MHFEFPFGYPESISLGDSEFWGYKIRGICIIVVYTSVMFPHFLVGKGLPMPWIIWLLFSTPFPRSVISGGGGGGQPELYMFLYKWLHLE